MSGYFGMSISSAQPDYPAALSKIQGMSDHQLQDLLSDDTKCEEFIKSLDQVKALYSEKEMLLASNKSLAEYNLSQEPHLREAKSNLQEKHREAARLAEKIRILKSDMDSKSGKTDPDTLLALLQAAGAEVEDESEQIAKDFLDSKFDNVDEFLNQFLEKRKLSNLRRIKIDKMKELMEKERGNLTPIRRAPEPPPAPAVYRPPSWAGTTSPPYPSVPAASPSNLPYPIHPVGLPSTPRY